MRKEKRIVYHGKEEKKEKIFTMKKRRNGNIMVKVEGGRKRVP